MSLLITNLYLFLMAVVLAVLEIQIEGQYGWAEKLPTWRPTNDKWYVRLYVKVMSGKAFTGYHLSMFGFVFLIFHLPYFFGIPLNWTSWLQTMSLFFFFLVLWDFLWFVLNPHYPLSKFSREHIKWHMHWLGAAPVDYYGGLFISLISQIILVVSQNSLTPFIWWLSHFGLFGLETIIVVLYSIHILKIDYWLKDSSIEGK